MKANALKNISVFLFSILFILVSGNNEVSASNAQLDINLGGRNLGFILHLNNPDDPLGDLIIYDFDTNQVVKGFDVGRNVIDIEISPNGKYLYVSSAYDGVLGRFEISQMGNDGYQPILLNFPYGPFDLTLSNDGKYLFLVRGELADGVTVIDTESIAVINDEVFFDIVEVIDFPAGHRPTGLTLPGDGNRLFVSNAFGHSVSVIDTSSYEIIDEISVGQLPQRFGVTIDDSYILVTHGWSNFISKIDISNDNYVRTDYTVLNDSIGATVTLDGQYAFVGNYGGGSGSTITKVDLLNPNGVHPLINTCQGPSSPQLSPDGNSFFVACADRHIEYNVSDGVQISEIITGYVNPRRILFYNSLNYSSPPLAQISLITSGFIEGGLVEFSASDSSDPNNDIVSYMWDVDGDGYDDGYGEFFEYSFPDNGSYVIRVLVSDSEGQTDVDEISIVVENTPALVNSLVFENGVLPGQEITLETSFSDEGILDIHTAIWDWGDGNLTSGNIVELNGEGVITGAHSYDVPGSYSVSIIVNDGDDDSIPVIATINVFTPVEAITDLIDVVEDMNLSNGIYNSLDAKFSSAINALDDINNNNNDQAGVNSLESFINAVEAQRSKAITSEEADILIAKVNEIIDYLLSQ